MINRFGQLFKNFSSLSAVNLINLVAPLIVIPFLINKLGLVGYGSIALHQYIAQFVMVLVDFGFPIYCVNEVAKRATNSDTLAKFVCSVYLIKIFIASVLLLATYFLFVLDLSNKAGVVDSLAFLFVFVGIANSFFPNWFYHGIEKIHLVIIPTALSKLLATIIIIALVDDVSDIWIVPVSYLLTAVILNIWSFCFLIRNGGFLYVVDYVDIKFILKGASEVFWSRLIIFSYVFVSPFIVRAVAGEVGVAIYNLCEKLINIIRMPFDILSTAAYPRLAKNYNKNYLRRTIGYSFFSSVLVVCLVLLILTLVADNLSADWATASKYLTLYVFSIVPISVHGLLGTCALVVNGYRLQVSVSIIAGLIAYVMTIGIGLNFLLDGMYVTIAAMVMVEFAILSYRFYYAKAKQLI